MKKKELLINGSPDSTDYHLHGRQSKLPGTRDRQELEKPNRSLTKGKYNVF